MITVIIIESIWKYPQLQPPQASLFRGGPCKTCDLLRLLGSSVYGGSDIGNCRCHCSRREWGAVGRGHFGDGRSLTDEEQAMRAEQRTTKEIPYVHLFSFNIVIIINSGSTLLSFAAPWPAAIFSSIFWFIKGSTFIVDDSVAAVAAAVSFRTSY